MSAVNAVRNATKHGVKVVRDVAKATTATATKSDARHGARNSSDASPNASSSRHERSNALKTSDGGRTASTKAIRITPSKPPVNVQQRQPPLLTFIHEPFPRSFNCTTFTSTRLIATDSSHPLYTRTKRRLASFDPTKLTWRVQVPMAVSKKPAIRRGAQKRAKTAARAELRELGFGEDGRRLGTEGEGREGDGKSLSGALIMLMNRDPTRSLTFKSGEVREEVREWVERTLKTRNRGGRDDFPRDHNPRRIDGGGGRKTSFKDSMRKGGSGHGSG
ncbi:hypothetical protein CLAFUW4_02002 [Fulvia fulva]|uniref:Uncharacterized protein n=1 Tax=Passalora fulva TaxID=5499 RepID=A0A9Q8L5B1_PASFU|nr:uncharacterized protein CLAFUR5_01995 [Fulvia fulva]KAK4634765.1 hypothetical protein CLAFUR4_01997 [Fulvia fulva]KAK4636858.1 hypothetical protein CLAFUR0_01999 [Fulvia fulva]UJO11089.1 hypothetical protein CLAFUR5_01995 [Fulvia fulva]WPV08160.1 hypothetical protein CLAFUW4_02002 [Fulvia fulva]WPV24421.1 hypothetical protein CLAFUW7_02002 [Fulvia fulva]